MSERGRITPIDVVFVGASVAALAFLAEPLYSLLNQSNNGLGPGVELLFRMIVPGLLGSLLLIVYITGLVGEP